MKFSIYTLLSCFLLPLIVIAQTSPSNENYILQTSYQKKYTQSQIENPNYTIPDDHKIESVVYYDGLGRPKQSIAIRAGGNREDLVTPVVYDPQGRQPLDYLPVPLAGNKGVFGENVGQGGVIQELLDYYDTKFPGDFEGRGIDPTVLLNPYSQKRFDDSPLNRVLEQAAPGTDWRLRRSDFGHTIKFDYQTNLAWEVRHFKVDFQNGNTQMPQLLYNNDEKYPANQLYKTVTKDENWQPGDGVHHTTEEFKNKLGQILLKRTFANGTWENIDTYYLYDDFGNLTYVLSPETEHSIISSGELIVNYQQVLDKLCYQYRYDHRNRLIWKKLPGKGAERILYDFLDRPVLTQDAEMAKKKQWLFTKYDALGRVAYTGIYTPTIGHNVEEEFSSLPAQMETVSESRTSTAVTVEVGGRPLYYTNTAYPTDNLEVLTINYYDDYVDYTVNTATGTISLTPPSTVLGVKTTENTSITSTAMGLSTVSWIKTLGSNFPGMWTTAVTVYDERGRVLQVDSYNRYLQARDRSMSKLDLITGSVLESFTTHTKSDQPPIAIKDYFTYDHMGRLLSQKQQINSEPIQLIAENKYDDLGQLVEKYVGGETALDGYTDMVKIDATADGTLYHSGEGWSWASRAKTRGRIESGDDGGISCTVPGNDKHIRMGLIKAGNASQSNPYFDYGIYTEYDTGTQTNKVRLVLGNTSSTGNYGTYTAGTTFKVERVGNLIKFYRDGIQFHSVGATSDALVGKVAFSGPGGSVENLTLTGPNIENKLQKINYRYNIRGWLTDINDVDPKFATLENSLFNFRINYNILEGNATGTPLYNGNISQTLWKTKGQDKKVRGYAYGYDRLNRITRAASYKGTKLGTMVLNSEYTLSGLSYDKNGNILTLGRYGADNNAVPSFGKWDQLTYTYSGNQLTNVLDTAGPSLGSEGFYGQIYNPGIQYTYDDNGNMKSDTNKGITTIAYNHLNLPEVVDLGNNRKITYIYDATGVKLAKKVKNGGTVSTQYAGGFIYGNAGGDLKLQFFSHPEGYVEPVSGEQSVKGFEVGLPGPTYSSYRYVYNYTDHLGNERLSYSDLDLNGAIDPNTEILSEKNYYPYGLTHKGYNSTVRGIENNHKQYQGQEYTEDLGLNIHEWKYRISDPAIGRFWQVDPLAEKYNWMTVYQFSSNQPIHAPELEGLENAADLILRTLTAEKLSSRGHGSFQENYKSLQRADQRAGGIAVNGALLIGASISPIPGDEVAVGGMLFKTGAAAMDIASQVAAGGDVDLFGVAMNYAPGGPLTKEAFDAIIDINTDGIVRTPFGSTEGAEKTTSEIITDFTIGVIGNKGRSNVSKEIKKSPVGRIVTEGVIKGAENISRQKTKESFEDEDPQ